MGRGADLGHHGAALLAADAVHMAAAVLVASGIPALLAHACNLTIKLRGRTLPLVTSDKATKEGGSAPRRGLRAGAGAGQVPPRMRSAAAGRASARSRPLQQLAPASSDSRVQQAREVWDPGAPYKRPAEGCCLRASPPPAAGPAPRCRWGCCVLSRALDGVMLRARQVNELRPETVSARGASQRFARKQQVCERR